MFIVNLRVKLIIIVWFVVQKTLIILINQRSYIIWEFLWHTGGSGGTDAVIDDFQFYFVNLEYLWIFMTIIFATQLFKVFFIIYCNILFVGFIQKSLFYIESYMKKNIDEILTRRKCMIKNEILIMHAL